MLKLEIKNMKIKNILVKQFSEKIHKNLKNTEKYIYLMTDKYSVTPEKEIKIKREQKGEKLIFLKEINNFQNINYFNIQDVKNKFKKSLTKIFLPRDYPNSVKEGYYHFSKYMFLAGTCFHIMNFLSSQALINSLGMSKGLSISLSAGLNWVLKDGIGQIGSIFFTGRYSNAIERDIKKWRIISLYMFNISILFEISTLWKPQYFLATASIATLLKLSAFISNSSTRAGIFNHYGNENNITDLTNKFFSQNNLSFLIGSVVGMTLSFYIPITFKALFPTICFLSIFHLYFAYTSTVKITLFDFNVQRAYYVAMEYIKSKTILPPDIANKNEVFFFNKLKYIRFCNLPLDLIFKREKNSEYLDNILNIFKDNKFLIYVEKKYSFYKQKYVFKIYTFLRLDAENIDIFMAFLYTINLNKILNDKQLVKKDKNILEEYILNSMINNLNWINEINKKEFISELKEKKWNLSCSLLEEKYLRYHLLFK